MATLVSSFISALPKISISIPFVTGSKDSEPKPEGVVPISVNYFPHRLCNYSCDFCFHTTKNLKILPIEDAKYALLLLAQAGMKKLNISGGEPFLKPDFIGEIFRYCKEELHIESCSIVNNGSKVTEKWLDTYGEHLDVMAISCDSFDPETNLRQGRSENGKPGHIDRVFEVADWCHKRGIKVKINTVVTVHNWNEDMIDSIRQLNPCRWKVFQCLLLDGENTGAETGSLRDARRLLITSEQFQAFLDYHKELDCLIPESNEAMKDSYLLLDEDMCFLNCQDGNKISGRSILQVGVEEALKDAGFDEKQFIDRKGIFDWKKDVKDQSDGSLDW
ncbi:radical SAM enzyme [Dendrothele bispora CBS 962.96]|uniref:Radical SAM enzyme n=1 Tax=Dendrothele bispora (strain CBS 962.96) TaxID=1314807 RepID=A0A4V4HHN0_DENBC|nr:radical SAM enzyme [Dendrothele bispora CBS 962.96]